MVFKKGQIPWNRGKKTGLVPKTSFRKGHVPWNKNLPGCFSDDVLKKMSDSHKGQKPVHSGGELPQIQWDKHPRWTGGAWSYNKNNNAVKLGLKPICKVCGEVGQFKRGSIEIHHIDKNRWNNAPENLMPLCVLHHKKVDRGKIPCPSLE